MMKFFRKYNKHLLAIFMAFLMVVFVGGSALQGLLSPSGNRTMATSRYGKITTGDQLQATATTTLLTGMGLRWQEPVRFVSQPLELIDWILLTREIKALGIKPDRAFVRSLYAQQGGEDTILELARSRHVAPDMVMDALVDLFSIQLATSVMEASTAPGAAEIREEADRVFSKVAVNAVTLPASAFVEKDSVFSEDRIRAQWEKYREIERGSGMNFGYYVPVSFNLQYLKIDPKKLADAIGIANLEKKARSFYEDRKQYDPRFRRPPDEEPPLPDVLLPEGVEKQQPEKPAYMDWEQARDAAIAAVRASQSVEIARRMGDWLLQAGSSALVGSARADDGYLQVPPRVASADFYQRIVSQLPSSLAFPKAIEFSQTGMVPLNRFSSVEGLGAAVVASVRSGTVKATDLLLKTKPVVGDLTKLKGVSAYDYYTINQPIPKILQDPYTGNFYLARVIDFRPAHVPESVDEVRDRVIDDLRLSEGYDIAKGFAESLIANDELDTLEERYNADQELVDIAQKHPRVGFRKVSAAAKLREGQLTFLAGLTPDRYAGPLGVVTEKVISEWFHLEFAASPRMVQELPDQARVLVVEWSKTSPVTESKFAEKHDRIASDLATRRSYYAIGDWLRPDNIRARAQFKQVLR